LTIVTEHLERHGIRFEVIPHRPTTTALGEAIALHLDADEVAKTVVLKTEHGYALAILPASRRLDLDLVRDELGEPRARLASEGELERDFPEFELGAMPPLPSMLHLPVVIDPRLFEHRHITFAAGVRRESVRAAPEGLFTGATITVAPISHAIRDPHTARWVLPPS
jgi:Ala-tRNA(Pro) deacylase